MAARVPAVEVVPASGPIEIDGMLDEAAWRTASSVTGFVQQQPVEGAPASEVTDVLLLLDDEALFVGARLRDSEPEQVVARMARRDQAVHADWFYVFLDSYHDRRTAFGFGVSAAGVQRDVRYAEDDTEDPSWDAVWESAVRRDGDGWVAELRIPLSQIRYNASASDPVWGMNFQRSVARKNEIAHWAPVPQGASAFVSLFGELRGVGGLEATRRIEVTPYTAARLTRAPVDPDDPFHSPNQRAGSVGADVRVGLGPSLTLSATLNPDFGQVEADPAFVNLSAFEVFQQERRPFFVEGSDIFSLAFPVWPPFFYSRRVGRAPQGQSPAAAEYVDRPEATTILGAVKLSGKTEDGWSLGLLDAVTPAEEASWVDGADAPGRARVEPPTNYAVGRVARNLGGGRTGVGTMVTAVNRRLDGGDLRFLHREAYGFAADGFHRWGGGAYEATVGLLGSHVRGDTTAIRRTQMAPGHYYQRPDARHVELDPSRTSLTGYSLHGRVQRIRGPWKWGGFAQATSPGFEVNDVGFNPALDHAQANAWLRFESYSPGSVFRSWNLGTMAMVQSTTAGELRELTNDLGFFFQLLNYWGGGVWVMRHRPAWDPTALRGGPAIRKPGRWMGSFSLDSDRRRDLSGNGFLFWEREDEGGGYTVTSSASITYRPSDRTQLTLGPGLTLGRRPWQYVGVVDGARGPSYLTGSLDQRTFGLGTRLDFTASPTLSLQLYARPFLGAGNYYAFRVVADPAASDFDDRFEPFQGESPDADYNLADLQMNAVLRWEYRPGSTLYAVWSHDRDTFSGEPWAVGADLRRLWSAPGRNVFMVKVSYWLGS